MIANKFRDNAYVIGYDIMNDPFAANLYWDASLVHDLTKFDREYLAPFYERIVETIKLEDDATLIFFSPGQFRHTFPLLGGGMLSNTGF